MVDFLVIGPAGAIGYKDIFPLIKDGDVGFGWNRVVEFEDGVKFGNIRWCSNISDYRPPRLVLKKDYRLDDYSRFDERPDIINIDRIEDICDYDGVMGVPVTFIEKWNCDQFDILGYAHIAGNINDWFIPIVDGECKFRRLLIKKR